MLADSGIGKGFEAIEGKKVGQSKTGRGERRKRGSYGGGSGD
jgi:hypothetical protein